MSAITNTAIQWVTSFINRRNPGLLGKFFWVEADKRGGTHGVALISEGYWRDDHATDNDFTYAADLRDYMRANGFPQCEVENQNNTRIVVFPVLESAEQVATERINNIKSRIENFRQDLVEEADRELSPEAAKIVRDAIYSNYEAEDLLDVVLDNVGVSTTLLGVAGWIDGLVDNASDSYCHGHSELSESPREAAVAALQEPLILGSAVIQSVAKSLKSVY